MVKIRLTRKGTRNHPFYRVVVAEDSHRRDGRFIDILGTYDPTARPAAIEIEAERVIRWLSKGAQPSDTVREILKRAGVWAHWRAVQQGSAKPGDMAGRIAATMERKRATKPSKKSAAKIAEAAKAESGTAVGS
ncbi:MAG: 30S ribosomal protein S16 [Candidatus Eiseniibacteriota bacterium]